MSRSDAISCWFLAVALCGCATTPPVVVNYYLPKVSLEITAARAISCGPDNVPYYVTTVAAPKAVYTRSDSEKYPIDLSSFDHFYADGDTGFTLTEDGRLVSINQSSAGQGSAIVKSVVALGTTLAALDSKTPPEGAAAAEGACKWLNSQTQNKALTVNYALSEDFTGDLKVDRTKFSRSLTNKDTTDTLSATADGKFSPIIGSVCVEATLIEDPTQDIGVRRITYAGKFSDTIHLTLRQPAGYEVKVSEKREGTECKSVLWKGTVYVPQQGQHYDLPVPKAALFGNRAFKLTMSDSGQVTSIEYSHTSGVSASLDAANSVAANFTKQTPADIAADYKAQADEIAQRNRLQKCLQDPTTCN